MVENLIYIIRKENISKSSIINLLVNHPEINSY
ncbi:hypothetical protein SFB2_282G1, partial [Candidatus Arthromitus sp. SFB-2]